MISWWLKKAQMITPDRTHRFVLSNSLGMVDQSSHVLTLLSWPSVIVDAQGSSLWQFPSSLLHQIHFICVIPGLCFLILCAVRGSSPLPSYITQRVAVVSHGPCFFFSRKWHSDNHSYHTHTFSTTNTCTYTHIHTHTFFCPKFQGVMKPHI